MPKGDTHVKKHDKRKFNYSSYDLVTPKENEGECIELVTWTFGSCRFKVKLINDDEEVQATATRSFQKGPRKEFIKIGDYVIIQPGISRDQYFINNKYSDDEVRKLNSLGLLNAKPKNSNIINDLDINDDESNNNNIDNTDVSLIDINDI